MLFNHGHIPPPVHWGGSCCTCRVCRRPCPSQQCLARCLLQMGRRGAENFTSTSFEMVRRSVCSQCRWKLAKRRTKCTSPRGRQRGEGRGRKGVASMVCFGNAATPQLSYMEGFILLRVWLLSLITPTLFFLIPLTVDEECEAGWSSGGNEMYKCMDSPAGVGHSAQICIPDLIYPHQYAWVCVLICIIYISIYLWDPHSASVSLPFYCTATICYAALHVLPVGIVKVMTYCTVLCLFTHTNPVLADVWSN